MKKVVQFLIVSLLAVATINVCFASDVGIPAANHSTIIKESPVILSNYQTDVAVIKSDQERYLINESITSNKEKSVFKIPPLAIKHESKKKIKAWC
jgi:hypothetical protein